MRVPMTERMSELYSEFKPYIYLESGEVKLKEDASDKTRQMYAEFLRLSKKQHELEISML